jgi:hypothetical protein
MMARVTWGKIISRDFSPASDRADQTYRSRWVTALHEL